MPGNYYDKLIIADTSCLIALSNVGQVPILKDLGKQELVHPLENEVIGAHGDKVRYVVK
jgi:hypothetical protein